MSTSVNSVSLQFIKRVPVYRPLVDSVLRSRLLDLSVPIRYIMPLLAHQLYENLEPEGSRGRERGYLTPKVM